MAEGLPNGAIFLEQDDTEALRRAALLQTANSTLYSLNNGLEYATLSFSRRLLPHEQEEILAWLNSETDQQPELPSEAHQHQPR